MRSITSILIKKYRVARVGDKGFTVQVKVNGYWKNMKYDKGHNGHVKGEYPMFDTYADAVSFGKKHTEGEYSEWVK